MIGWPEDRIALNAGARLVLARSSNGAGGGAGPGPTRAAIDSRRVLPGDLFLGLPGEHGDGGEFAEEALARGAWGVLVAPSHADRLARQGGQAGAVLAHPEPLAALQRLAGAWREELGARVVAITGSTGKTSTKDILAALLRPHRRVATSPENFNTEIGLPLALLEAQSGTEVLVLEMAMRGPRQIAELAGMARPHVGVIVNVGPVHLELLGSLENVAAAKAELIEALAPGAAVVLPADEPLLTPHVRADLRTVTFGAGGDVQLVEVLADGEAVIRSGERELRLRPSFQQAHNLRNLLAATAVAELLGVEPRGSVDPSFSPLRGEQVRLADGIVLINDCYNANPLSVRAALEDLADRAAGRRVAVLGDMLELGEDEARLHRAVADDVRAAGVELLVTVGPLAALIGEGEACESHAASDADAAAGLLRDLLRPGDTVLVKGSRAVHLERVAGAFHTVAESV
jgi:UDP-N-acetylmuramoyl-tripeptide--D-alanyl-D-alanine ligase